MENRFIAQGVSWNAVIVSGSGTERELRLSMFMFICEGSLGGGNGINLRFLIRMDNVGAWAEVGVQKAGVAKPLRSAIATAGPLRRKFI